MLAAVLRKLRARELPPLAPAGAADLSLTPLIDALFPSSKGNAFFLCVRSGLHVWNDDLPRAHEIAQEVKTADGGYWHGILHRREGDFDNAAYWFRRVGRHPVFEPLKKAVLRLDPKFSWDPFAFVDACAARREDALLRKIQLAEIELLLDHCLRAAGITPPTAG